MRSRFFSRKKTQKNTKTIMKQKHISLIIMGASAFFTVSILTSCGRNETVETNSDALLQNRIDSLNVVEKTNEYRLPQIVSSASFTSAKLLLNNGEPTTKTSLSQDIEMWEYKKPPTVFANGLTVQCVCAERFVIARGIDVGNPNPPTVVIVQRAEICRYHNLH